MNQNSPEYARIVSVLSSLLILLIAGLFYAVFHFMDNPYALVGTGWMLRSVWYRSKRDEL